MVVLKNAYVLSPSTFKYVILHGKWDFVDMMKITDHQVTNYPGLSRWP